MTVSRRVALVTIGAGLFAADVEGANSDADGGAHALRSRENRIASIADSMPSVNASSFGINPGVDCSAQLQMAIDRGSQSENGLTIYFDHADYFLSNVFLKSRVHLAAISYNPIANPDARIGTRFISRHSGAIIDTLDSEIVSAGLTGITFLGSGAGVPLVGVRFRHPIRCFIRGCGFKNIADQAIQFGSSGKASACLLMDNLAEDSLLRRSYTEPAGVLEVAGYDHWIVRGEYGASVSFQEDVNENVCAVLLHGTDHFVSDLVAEFSSQGLYVASNRCRFYGVRAENNLKNGWNIMATNDFLNCASRTNSRAGDGLFDEWFIQKGESRFTNCWADSNAKVRARYGFRDIQSSTSSQNRYYNCRGTGQRAGPWSISRENGASVNFGMGPAHRFESGNEKPSVSQYCVFETANLSAATLEDFIDGIPGQGIHILCGDENTSVASGQGVRTMTGKTQKLTRGRMYQFLRLNEVWYEIANG